MIEDFPVLPAVLSRGKGSNPGGGNSPAERNRLGLKREVRLQGDCRNLAVIADDIQLCLDGISVSIPILLLRGGLQQYRTVTGEVTIGSVDRPRAKLPRCRCETKGSRNKQEEQGGC